METPILMEIISHGKNVISPNQCFYLSPFDINGKWYLSLGMLPLTEISLGILPLSKISFGISPYLHASDIYLRLYAYAYSFSPFDKG
jgi:hypothetical protein